MNKMTATIEKPRPATPEERLGLILDRLKRGTMKPYEAIAEVSRDAGLLKTLFKITSDQIGQELRTLSQVNQGNSVGGHQGFAPRGQYENANDSAWGAVQYSDAHQGHPSIDRSPPFNTASRPDREEGRARLRLPMRPHFPCPPQHPSSSALTAAAKVAKMAAHVVLIEIDGRDIRDWTIGQCRSAGRRKAREARVLAAIGERLGHLTHTVRVGDVMNNDELREVISSA